MEYRLVRSKRRTIALQIENDGTLTIRAPLWMSQGFIQHFMWQKMSWIERTKQRMEQSTMRPHKRFVEGEEFLFLGTHYPLILTDHHTQVTLNRQLLLPRSLTHKTKEALTHWYMEQARLLFTERLELYTEQMNVTIKGLRLSNAKRRWGSCSTTGSINLNWRLIMAPMAIVDYVIVHELAHVHHMNHSKTFWAKVERHHPSYKTSRSWLRANGHNLSI